MSITLEQLQDRSEARNVAQWDWRVLDPECHMAGNSPILNLRFERTIKPAKTNRGVRRMFTSALLRQRRILGRDHRVHTDPAVRHGRKFIPARSHRGVRCMLTIAKLRRMRAGLARKGIPSRTQRFSFRGFQGL